MRAEEPSSKIKKPIRQNVQASCVKKLQLRARGFLQGAAADASLFSFVFGLAGENMARSTQVRFAISGIFLLIIACSMALFGAFGTALFPAYRNISRALMAVLASASNAISPVVSVCDYLLVGLVVLAVASLVFCVVRRMSLIAWFSHVCLVIAAVALVVVCGWALNHYAPPLSQEIELDVQEYTAEELYDATEHYWQRAAAYATQVQRDSETHQLVSASFDKLSAKAGEAFAPLAQRYEVFDGSTAPVKRLSLLGDALLYTGSDGIFIPLTGEANVPANCAYATLAFNMCHEVAHRLGIAAEEEANFAAFMACEASGDPDFSYSGYYRAFVACYNALAQNYPSLAGELFAASNLSEEKALVIGDMLQTSNHYATYDGAASEVGQAANDAYLKTFGQQEGTKSYGQWVDYLIAWRAAHSNAEE